MTDYTPRLDPEIELCAHCGERVHRLGPEAAIYCYRCGNHGQWPTVVYVRKDVCVHIDDIPRG